MSKNGQLLGAYYRSLVEHPVPLVPFNPNALIALADICEATESPITPSGLVSAIGLAGPQSSKGWESVSAGPFVFPQDHGPHWKIRNEWYYLACNLTYTVNSVTKPIFILLAIIRRGVVPHNDTYTPQQLQVVACESTIEMPTTTTPYLSSSNAFDGFDANSIINLKAPGTNQNFNWSCVGQSKLFGLSSTTAGEMFPMNCGISFLTSGNVPVEVQLTMDAPTTPAFFLQGEEGCAPCIDGLGYRYYSWPALTVSGTVNVGTTSYTCSGQGWLDHQWGSRMQPLGYVDNLYLRALGVLGNTYPKTITPKWDWFFVHLSNGMHITTVVLPSNGFASGVGPVNLTNTTVVFVDTNKNLTYDTFQGGTVLYSKWVNANCNMYASSWLLTIGDNIQLTLDVTQDPPAGFSQGADGQTFMEKGVTVKGFVNRVAVTGTGFAEAIGYDSLETQATKMLNQLVPIDQVSELYPLFLPASASGEQIALATLIVIVPPVVVLLIIIVLAVVLSKKAKLKRMQSM